MAARVGARGRRGKRPPVYTTVDDQGRTDGKKAKTPEELAEDRRVQAEAEGIQLLSVVSRIKAQDTKVEEARAALKTQTDALNGIFLNAKAASPRFTRGRLRELVNDSKPSERRNVQENEEVRARFRKLMGLPVGLSDTEQELEERLPDVEREGAFWFQAGYTAGVTGDKRDAPAACVAAGHDNRFEEGYQAGQAVLVVNKGALSGKKAVAPKADPPAETGAERKAREKREEEAAKSGLATIGAGSGADTVTDPEAAAPALDDVQASVKAASEGYGDPLKGDESTDDLTIVDSAENCTACGQPPGTHHLERCPVYLQAAGLDFVEATPEELAAQTTRKAVQEGREGEAVAAPEPTTEAV